MNPPQSLKDPRAEKAAADPAVELAREYRAAIDRLNAPDEIADEDTGDFLATVTTPLEEKLARTRPTTREGIIETLGVATQEARNHFSEPLRGPEAMVIGVIENVCDALKAGVGTTEEAGPDPLVILWVEWNGLRDVRVPDGLDDDEAETFNEETGDRMTVLEDWITATTPRSFVGALVQISVLIFRVDAGHPHTKEPTLVDLQKGVEATLAGIAAGPGGAS